MRRMNSRPKSLIVPAPWQCVLLLLVIVGYNKVHSQDTTCGAVGHSDQTEYSRLTNAVFYLNTQNPAPCSGTVITWEYCYYNSTDMTAEEYRAPFGIYRLNGNSYELVSEMFVIVISNNDVSNGSFTCGTFPVPSVTTIQEGDVVGVCINDLNDGTQAHLNLVGSSNSSDSVQFAPTSNNLCNDGGMEVVLPGSVINRGNNGLSDSPSTVLHLYANVSQPTTEPPTTATMETATPPVPGTAETTTQTDTSETTTFNTPGDTGTSSTGAIIGVIVALLLILIISIIAVLTVILVRNKKSDSYKIDNVEFHTSDPNAIQNVLYDALASKAQLEASNYEIPVSSHLEPQTSDSTEINHTYSEVVSNPPFSIYDSPLDSNIISFSAILQKNEQEDIYADLQPYQAPSTLRDADAIYGLIRGYGIIDIPRLVISSVGYLGSGQFANVEEGTWKKGVNKEVRVALKTIKQGATEEDKIKFLQEAAIMAQFRHPNVIALYGVVSQGDPVILVTELMEKGDLRHYLGSIRPDPGELPPADLPKLLLIFSQQVALGMQYLAGKGFVHRDLAARNILVSENKICKVSDFGMSRDLADETYYVAHGGKIPVKWTAPEALHYKKYSTASDVWSYGCLLYEIWSVGRKPFEGISNSEAMRLLESGIRLSPPPGCPRMIYQLMILCWNPATSHRPLFRDLVLTLVGNQELVLSIPQDAIETHQLAGVLGAPLEAGENMYQDLQDTYMHMDQDHGTEELDNDYEDFD